jgi:enoyl-CoA hydratase/carnithine racemase
VSQWQLERHGGIAVARFSAPPRNFMTFAGMTELEQLVMEVAADLSVTVLVLASDTEGYFVAHGDLDDLLKLGRGEPFDGDAASWPRTLGMFATMPQVVVAAINGQAWGGGLEMSLACTLRVAGPHAHMALCEVGLGLIPGGGGTQRLPRLIGAGRAAELILSGRVVGAEEAHRLGIVEHLEPHEPFLDNVLSWLVGICRRPPASLRAAKRAIIDGLALPLEDGLALEGSLVGPLLADPVAIELQEKALVRYRETPPREVVLL